MIFISILEMRCYPIEGKASILIVFGEETFPRIGKKTEKRPNRDNFERSGLCSVFFYKKAIRLSEGKYYDA